MGYIEDVLRMAEARQMAAKQQKDQQTIDKIEEGALQHKDLRGQDADWTDALSDLNTRLQAARTSLEQLAIQAGDVESNQALQANPDLLEHARALIEGDRERLNSAQAELSAQIENVQGQIQTARQAGGDLSAGIRPYLSKKEVPEKKLDEIWRYT